MNENNNLRYILYARKSSESEDRQMASIDDQVIEMLAFAEKRGLNVVGTVTESKSAKAPGRPGFNELVQRIHDGEADAVLAWKVNRLARNPIDSGTICWMLQEKTLKHIQTRFNDHKPEDNVLYLQIEFGTANQFSKNLSGDITRGARNKALRGWYPAPVLPMAYLHNHRFKKGIDDEILPDPEYFGIIKGYWDKILNDGWTIMDIKRDVDSIKLLNRNGKIISKNALYDLFANPFYCGLFWWKDEDGNPMRIEGKHKPMISVSEFQQARVILSGKKRGLEIAKHDVPYRGMISCGECDCKITAEVVVRATCEKCKKQFSIKNRSDCTKCGAEVSRMKDPKIYRRTYYRCSKKKGPCSQKFVDSETLENQIASFIRQISIPSEITSFFYDIVEKETFQSLSDRIAPDNELVKLSSLLEEVKQKKDRLIDMRTNGEITGTTLKEKLTSLEDQQSSLEVRIEQAKAMENLWRIDLKKAVDISAAALDILENGSYIEKTKLLSGIGSNFSIMHKKLLFTKDFLLFEVGKLARLTEAEMGRLELKKNVVNKGENTPFGGVFPVVCTALVKVRIKWFKKKLREIMTSPVLPIKAIRKSYGFKSKKKTRRMLSDQERLTGYS